MIGAVVYDADGVTEYDDVETARAAEGTTWVRVSDAAEPRLREVADVFGIHPLAVEDVTNNVRPKTEEFPTYTFTLLKTAELARGEQSFDEEVRDEAVGPRRMLARTPSHHQRH